ncbi:MAG TPA: LCP family protein, partial [Pseudonocardia sp.]|nr:LCP family protein [Pseudonocardia sp.]
PRPAPPRRRPAPARLGRALLATAAAAVAPGAGHLLLGRRETGRLILAAFVIGVTALVVLVLTVPRSELLERLLSTRVLVAATLGLALAGGVWVGVVVRTWALARPPGLHPGQRLLGAAVVTVLCLAVATPFGLAANLADSQRSLLDALFPGGRGGDPAAITQPRLNILLLGSDAGPDREGTRTDTMMVASIDTHTGHTILFGLPRNIQYARFPPGSAMAAQFPDGFHDPSAPRGDRLLNAVYAYGLQFPELAPPGPTDDPGINLLQSSIGYMLGLPIHYYLELNMAGFASIIDALGGLTVDVGPERLPVGGITPGGREVAPDRYLEPGVRLLDGEDALAFARSRTGTSDYARMGRQRCLIQYVLEQKSPTDLITNFQAVATATTSSVFTNIPREVLPALVDLAGRDGGLDLASVSFDPNLPDPDEPDGFFNPGDPNVPYMREVVRDAIARGSAPPPAPAPAAPPPTGTPFGTGLDDPEDGGATAAPTPAPTAAPAPVAASC